MLRFNILCIFILFLFACDEKDSSDCSLERNQCASGFVCEEKETGGYACVPDDGTDGAQGGAAGDASMGGSDDTGMGGNDDTAMGGNDDTGMGGNDDTGMGGSDDTGMGGNDDTGMGGTNLDPSLPVFPLLDCGSEAAMEVRPGTLASSATELPVGQLVTARIDPEAITNSRHVYKITFEPGFYHLVFEQRRADRRDSNLGVRGYWVDENGENLDRILNINDVEPFVRTRTFFEVVNREERYLAIEPLHYAEDYYLQFVNNGTPVASPFFEDCPELSPFVLDQEYAFSLNDDEEQWYFAETLTIGDYLYDIAASRMRDTNMQFSIHVLDRWGEFSRWDRLILFNEVTAATETTVTHNVSEDSHFWIRVQKWDSRGPLNINFTTTQQ